MEPLVDAVFITSVNCGTSSIQVYDTATGSNLKSYNGTAASPSSLSFIGKCEYVMTGQKDKPLLQAWRLHKSEPLQIRLVVPGRVSVMAVNTSGPLYSAVAIGEKIFIYKLSTGRLIGVLRQHYQTITCLKFTPCGFYLVSGGEDGLVMRWNMSHIIDALHLTEAPEPHFKLAQHSDKVTDLVISSGFQGILISTSLDSTANVYDLLSGKIRYTIIAPNRLNCVTTNALGCLCFLGDLNGNIWNMKLLPHSSKTTLTIKDTEGSKCHDSTVTCMTMTAAGNQVITGDEDGEVKVWTMTNIDLVSSLALQRILHTGRGTITNITVLRMEREIFNSFDLQTNEVISAITSATVSDVNTEVTIYVGTNKRDRRKQPFSLLDTNRSLMNDSMNAPVPVGEYEDLKSSIEMLKSTNSELYKFALQHIIGPD